MSRLLNVPGLLIRYTFSEVLAEWKRLLVAVSYDFRRAIEPSISKSLRFARSGTGWNLLRTSSTLFDSVIFAIWHTWRIRMVDKTETRCEIMWLVVHFLKIFSLTIGMVVDSYKLIRVYRVCRERWSRWRVDLSEESKEGAVSSSCLERRSSAG